MAKSAAIPLAAAGIGAIVLISGIEGESLADVIKGNFGKGTSHEFPDPTFKGSTKPEEQVVAENAGIPVPQALYGKLISPFPKSSGTIIWGRSDQGVDGIVKPGSPMVAMGNGIVEIAHNCPGFGCNYPVLHIDNDGSYYYGHSEPLVKNGERVHAGQLIANANTNGQGNATTPGSFEIGTWPPGNFQTAGAQIRSLIINLPRL